MISNLQIISSSWIAPVVPRGKILNDHSIVILDDRIENILPTSDALKKYPHASKHELDRHLLIPGLINTHTHAGMSLFRGIADDIPLMDWLNNHMWPAEQQWVNPEFMRDGSQLAIAEMLLSGTTCFNDMYFFPDIVARTAQEMGIRAVVGLIMIDFPSAWANNPDEYFSKGIQTHDEIRPLTRVSSTWAPHAPYTVSDDPLSKVLTYADELQIPIHMHIHETAQEIKDSIDQYGQRPLQRLNGLGLVNPRLLAVHMTQLNDDEIQLAADSGIHVVHCPESNMKLASGICRVADLIDIGVNVSLGTDSAASNNDLDMILEMRSAALLAKISTMDAEALPAWQCLEMATINGAKALNLHDQIGSLEIGKCADIVAVDLGTSGTQPVYNPVSQLVYSASGQHVNHVWVNGKQRVRDRQLLENDEQQIVAQARTWQQRMTEAAGE